VFKFYVAPIILSRYWKFHQSNETCDLAGAGVNQAAGRQLAIAALDRAATGIGGTMTRNQINPTSISLTQYTSIRIVRGLRNLRGCSLWVPPPWGWSRYGAREDSRFTRLALSDFSQSVLFPSQQADDHYSFVLWTSILLTFEENKQNQLALHRCEAVICQISFPWILLKYWKSFVCCHSIITLCTFMFTYRVLFGLKAFTSLSIRDAIHFTGDEMECRAVTSQ
jgi:hypothetical protein